MKKIFRLLLLGFLTVTVLSPRIANADAQVNEHNTLPSISSGFMIKRETNVRLGNDESVEFKYKAQANSDGQLFVAYLIEYVGFPSALSVIYEIQLLFPERSSEPVYSYTSNRIGGGSLGGLVRKYDSGDGVLPNDKGWYIFKVTNKRGGDSPYRICVQISDEQFIPFWKSTELERLK